MFDSPRKVPMARKNIGILDFDKNLLENLSVGKKPNSLPPLASQDRSCTTMPENNNKRNLTKSLSNPQPVHKRISVGLTAAHSPRESELSSFNNVDALIKDAAKSRHNDFDALCAQLVQQTEDERRYRKQSYRPDTPSHYKPTNPVNRKNTFRVNDDDKESDISESDEDTIKNRNRRPKTSTANRAERPKTGYGRRRRQTVEET